MHLIQILLPTRGKNGKPFPATHYQKIRHELAHKFNGLTAYTRAPAEGLWKDGKEEVEHDDIIIFEVMIKKLDKTWWKAYQKSLEKKFQQESVIIRCQDILLI